MTKIKTVDIMLATFEEELKKLNGPNMLIGGSCALVIHGLNVSWPLNDLDIFFVGELNKDQEVFFRTWGPGKHYKLGQTIEHNLNFLGDPIPAPLVQYKGYNVNSVANIIKAKTFHNEHCRFKDVQQLQLLKNLNFNYD